MLSPATVIGGSDLCRAVLEAREEGVPSRRLPWCSMVKGYSLLVLWRGAQNALGGRGRIPLARTLDALSPLPMIRPSGGTQSGSFAPAPPPIFLSQSRRDVDSDPWLSFLPGLVCDFWGHGRGLPQGAAGAVREGVLKAEGIILRGGCPCGGLGKGACGRLAGRHLLNCGSGGGDRAGEFERPRHRHRGGEQKPWRPSR